MRLLRLLLLLVVALSFAGNSHAFPKLAWDANAEPIDGYKLYYGTSSSQLNESIDVGNVTQYEVSGLAWGLVYRFAVTAYWTCHDGKFYNDQSCVAGERLESDFSNIVAWSYAPEPATAGYLTWREVEEQQSMADPSFAGLGTLDYKGESSASSLASTITNVSVGDLLFVVVQRNNQENCTGVASSSPALTFTKIKSALSDSNNFNIDLFAAIATQAAASMTITASYSNSYTWGAMFSFRYSPGSITSITPQASNAHTYLQSSTTNRTAPNIVTSTRTLLIAAGTDWDYYLNHTAAANWIKRVDSDTFGNDTTTQFVHERIADAGTYPNGNFATVNISDQYVALIVAFEIAAGGTTTSSTTTSSTTSTSSSSTSSTTSTTTSTTSSTTSSSSSTTSSSSSTTTTSLLQYQYAKPIEDISLGEWLPSEGDDLFAMVDESSPNDADFIYSSNHPENDTCEMLLSSLSDPEVDTGHTIRYRFKKVGADIIDLTFYLMEGAVQIASWAEEDLPTDFENGSYTLSPEEAAEISDYSNLRVKIVAQES